MDEPPADNAPLRVAESAAKQLEAAVRFILNYHPLDKISLISHSWGSMPLGRLLRDSRAIFSMRKWDGVKQRLLI